MMFSMSYRPMMSQDASACQAGGGLLLRFLRLQQFHRSDSGRHYYGVHYYLRSGMPGGRIGRKRLPAESGSAGIGTCLHAQDAKARITVLIQ